MTKPTAHVMLLATALLALVFASHARAAAPAPGSQDFEELMPYAGWIATQATNRGGLCCSLSDCRIVRWRAHDGAYEAFVATVDDRGFPKFSGAPNAWLPVPDEVIKREVNPSGQAIACWSRTKPDQSGFYCFFLPEMG